MDITEAKYLKNGFAALNENLTDIAKSLRKLAEKEKERWRTIEVDGYPDPEYEWVLVIVSCSGELDKVPLIAKYSRTTYGWTIHFGYGYADRPLNSDCEVVKWLPILGRYK